MCPHGVTHRLITWRIKKTEFSFNVGPQAGSPKRNIINIYYWGTKEMCQFIVYFPQKTEKALILKHHDEQENPVS